MIHVRFITILEYNHRIIDLATIGIAITRGTQSGWHSMLRHDYELSRTTSDCYEKRYMLVNMIREIFDYPHKMGIWVRFDGKWCVIIYDDTKQIRPVNPTTIRLFYDPFYETLMEKDHLSTSTHLSIKLEYMPRTDYSGYII